MAEHHGAHRPDAPDWLASPRDAPLRPPTRRSAIETAPMNPFRAAVEAGDHAAVEALLAQDVVFNSPAVYRPYRGKPACAHLLAHVTQVFEDFRYVDEVVTEDRIVLIFAARVGDKELQGLDHLVLDDDGRITEFTVMVRPLSGLIAVATAMGERLESDPVPS